MIVPAARPEIPKTFKLHLLSIQISMLSLMNFKSVDKKKNVFNFTNDVFRLRFRACSWDSS
jgi:hypothetical protein